MLRNRQLFLSHVAQTSDMPMMIDVERASGIYLYNSQGKKYIDLISGISVSALGHCYPAVVNAVKQQADKYLHTMVYGEYLLAPQIDLAALLTDQLPERLKSVYFVNSGAEATEGAMKLAKRYTGRTEIISCFNAYHGSTQGAMSLMSDPFFTQNYRPLLPGINHIEFNNQQHLHKITEKTAAVIVETVKAESGVTVPENDYLKHLRKRCTETGTLLVFDEIQVGYGRTGSLFAFEQYGVEPDVLLLAKGMGGGMPIGAFVASKEIMSVFMDNPFLGHITTFGGHPVTCAAALATLEELLEQPFIQQVKAKEQLFHKLLQHPSILEIRSAGFLMAVQLRDFGQVKAVISECTANGLITDWFLFNDSCLRIAPPLIITEEEIHDACQILRNALDKCP